MFLLIRREFCLSFLQHINLVDKTAEDKLN